MQYDLIGQYSFAMYFAMSIVTVLFNIYLIMKIRYGKELITKSTLNPYYVTLTFLILNFIKSLIRWHISRDFPDKLRGALDYYNNVDGNILIALTRVFDSYINTVFVYFIVVRIDSC